MVIQIYLTKNGKRNKIFFIQFVLNLIFLKKIISKLASVLLEYLDLCNFRLILF